MSTPKRLIVEYEDGSTKAIDFNNIDTETLAKLARAGICPVPGKTGMERTYLLMQWADNNREVLGISGKTVDLLRYYVIKRIEEQGRLAINIGADYPELFILTRMPMQLRSLLLIGNEGDKKYNLESEVERWEGIFEEGGKKEYIKYDSTDQKYPHGSGDASGVLSEIMNSVKNALNEKGSSPQKVLDFDRTQAVEEYNEIARAIGIRAYQNQADVCGFIDFIVRKLAKNGS